MLTTSVDIPEFIRNLPVIILAGGKGTRLRSVVSDRPKVLAMVQERPFLLYLLDNLQRQGVRRVVLCTGYMAEKIEKLVGKCYNDIIISYSVEELPLGTGGAVLKACSQINSHHFLVMNGDSFIRYSLVAFIHFCLKVNADAGMVLKHMPDACRYGRVEMDASHRVTSFTEKNTTGPGMINSGVYFFQRDTLEGWAGGPCSLEHDILSQLVSRRLYGFPCDAGFIDIGTEESYHQAQLFFSDISKINSQI